MSGWGCQYHNPRGRGVRTSSSSLTSGSGVWVGGGTHGRSVAGDSVSGISAEGMSVEAEALPLWFDEPPVATPPPRGGGRTVLGVVWPSWPVTTTVAGRGWKQGRRGEDFPQHLRTDDVG